MYHVQNLPEPSTSQSVQSEIVVPTIPKRELVMEWLMKSPSLRSNPASSDKQPISYSEENVWSDGGQDDDINYMLSKITKGTQFVQEPSPIRKSKKSTTMTTKAEVYRPLNEGKLEINSSTYFSDKERDYVKIAADASDNPITTPFSKITQMTSASSESYPSAQYYGEGVLAPVQQEDSMNGSSDTRMYVSSIDTPPYIMNENIELLEESKYDSVVNTGKKVYVSPSPSIILTLPVEDSSASFQGEDYISEKNSILLDSRAATDESTHSHLNIKDTNPNATAGLCHVV